MPQGDAETREALLVEHQKLLCRIQRWRAATRNYRWANIILFMLCKLVVPTGALIVAMDMIAIVMGRPFLDSIVSAIIAIFVTFLASLEAMLNPGAKKRLAFNLNNELSSIEYNLCMAKIDSPNDALTEAMARADAELKKLLNHYSENGY